MKFGKDYTKTWVPWFAWYPVRVGTEWVWLETVDTYFNTHYNIWCVRERV